MRGTAPASILPITSHVEQSPWATSSDETTPFCAAWGSSSTETESYPFSNSPPTDTVRLRFLVAEDNPLNAKVLKV